MQQHLQQKATLQTLTTLNAAHAVMFKADTTHFCTVNMLIIVSYTHIVNTVGRKNPQTNTQRTANTAMHT